MYTMQWSLQVFGLMCIVIARNASPQFIYPNENSCEARNKKSGICIVVSDCSQFRYIIEEKPLAQSTIRYLQNSHCGFEGTKPKVCCEISKIESRPMEAGNGVSPHRVGNEDRPQQPSLDSLNPPNVTNHPNLRLLEHHACGPINSDRIIGGNKTGLFEFPWMALLAYRTEGPNPEFRCGGSIINQRYVLTAAHCVTNLPSKLKLTGIRVGEHDITTERDCEMAGTFEEVCAEKYQDIHIEKVDPHPDFSTQKLHNDIALIRLRQNIDFRPQNVKPICLPIGSAAKITSKKLMATGWGITEDHKPSAVMMKIALPRYPQEECAAAYRSQKEIWQKQICMGGGQVMDSCRGDSGGPLQAPTVYNGNPRYVQYGIVSFGVRKCGTEGFPGVYTRVDYYLDWILDAMRD